MIRLVGSAKRSFLFPSDLRTALHYFNDMGGLFQYLPYITLVKTYTNNRFRVLYRSTELGIYQIQLYSDIEVHLDAETQTIDVRPLTGKSPVRPRAGLHSLRGMALYRSTSRFKPEGDCTRVYYHLHLDGHLPTPKALGLVPGHITDHIAKSIANRRIYEIADGFIAGALKDFAAGHECAASPNGI